MSTITSASISPKCRVYLSVIIISGMPVLAYCAYKSLTASSLDWLYLAVLVAIGSFFPVKIPSLKQKRQSVSLTTGEVFVFTALLLFGVEIATTTSLLDALFINFRIGTKQLYKRIFNLVELGLAAFVAGRMFYFLEGKPGPLDPEQVSSPLMLFLHLAASAALYFVLNAAAVGMAMALESKQPLIWFWKKDFLWVGLTNLTAASGAVLIFLYFKGISFYLLLIAIPIVLVIYYTYRVNDKRLKTVRKSWRFFKSALNALPANVAILDEEGKIIAVNEPWRRFAEANHLFGPRHGLGTKYIETCQARGPEIGEKGPELAAGIQQVINGKSNESTLEYEAALTQGKRWFMARVTRFKGKGPTRVVVAHEDITARKKAEDDLRASEEKLRQAQKMEAIGTLAGGVAHDFNNLLTAIICYGELAKTRISADSPVQEDVQEILDAANRAASLTRQLLAFSRKQRVTPQIVDLNDCVSEMEKMLRRLIGEHISLFTVLSANLGLVKTDPGQIQQVTMNLVVNARDAMPNGGKLTIETANITVDANRARLNLQPGPYVMLAVTDTGHGMDSQTQQRIFEPFFTTKDKGKGTGLGLSTVYGIVTQWGGDIQVQSELGKGTIFRIYLPRAIAEEAEMTITRTDDTSPSKGFETILVAEDEDSIRNLVCGVLKRSGYRVLVASDGREAMEVAENHQGRIDLLLTDVVMPNMSGPAVAARMELVRPEMKVLYISGYTEDVVSEDTLLNLGENYLQKPFAPTTLLNTVRRILDGEKLVSLPAESQLKLANPSVH